MLNQLQNKKKKPSCLPQKEKKKYTMYLFVFYQYYIGEKIIQDDFRYLCYAP